ncbi:GNAT family N-acetyltransferase [Neorhizobium galegae]|uniref:GNAT family N-acetyltransferase n=1 Tax=Neorhizobium galegae TaxID=399 RepID=UPI000621D018|nr:GNAT family N-acetyltransferase [Neorhizobium galegae]MCQ1764837.1 GNAT family N-acetyltransferase [Neorhizobium galegae]MCQ1845543.1 GNAT family N-acetyltransferase [Neorhizobium galegae]CDZ38804.1 Putative GCN5-related N-acetyltransferase (GNAT) [Neorhizobium galegae bv. officinalis]
MTVVFRKLCRGDMAEAASVHRISFDDRLPWLAQLHTPEEDRGYWRGNLFATCDIWGAERNGTLLGVIAFREDWVDQLYILPGMQGQGIGSRLLDIAKGVHSQLFVWTFQRNAAARRFYEARGFVQIRQTDGAANEEKEPDVLYRWGMTTE